MDQDSHNEAEQQLNAPRVNMTIRLDAGPLGVYTVTDSFILPDTLLILQQQAIDPPGFEFPSRTAGRIHTSYVYH